MREKMTSIDKGEPEHNDFAVDSANDNVDPAQEVNILRFPTIDWNVRLRQTMASFGDRVIGVMVEHAADAVVALHTHPASTANRHRKAWGAAVKSATCHVPYIPHFPYADEKGWETGGPVSAAFVPR